MFGSFGRSVGSEGVWVFRLSQMVRFAPFFFFFFFVFRPNSAVSADSADTGRYGPSRPDLGRIGADFGRVGPIRESPRGTTQHGRAVCGVPPASRRVGHGCARLGAASVHPRKIHTATQNRLGSWVFSFFKSKIS